MIRRPPGSTRTDTHFPDTKRFRSHRRGRRHAVGDEAVGLGAAGGQVYGREVVAVRDASRVPAVRCASRSEEHTSELQSLMRTSNAVFCLKQNTPTLILTAAITITISYNPR